MMFYVSEIRQTAPAVFQTPLQQAVYQTLERLGIPFERVDTDEAIKWGTVYRSMRNSK